ncbi:MAG: hypothetical protein ABIQ52_01890 [Vicinamibacterales bacterium]
MTAIVSSIVRLLRRAPIDADQPALSNRCATSPSVSTCARFVVTTLLFTPITVGAAAATGQDPGRRPEASSTTSEHRTVSGAGQFLAGAAVGLGAHESGHLLFDGLFKADPGIRKVSFHGLPFFAITHKSGLSPRREFTIDSAGFWVQEATNEWILSRRPRLRRERAPLVKGVFAFNVLASASYAGAAFARTGPVERDTRGMADSLRWKEPYIGVLILLPAVLDTLRYFHPDARWAAWGSRAAKLGGVALIAR